MLDVGLIGLGADWEKRFRPVLTRLRPRLRIKAIYSPVSHRAEPVAAEFQAVHSPGLCALLERPDLRAILLLDSGWTGHLPAELACARGKPVFFAGASGIGSQAISLLAAQSAESGTTVMPELRLRYLPATLRLRELLATQLGRPHHIRLHLAAPTEGCQSDQLRARLVELLDWCRALVGTAPVDARRTGATSGRNGTLPHASSNNGALHPGPTAHASTFEVLFAQPARGGAATRAEILIDASTTVAALQPLAVRMRVECERGWAEIDRAHAITWSTADAQGSNSPATVEALDEERDDLELMLDHFSRRVVGGLVPVPTFEDIRDAWELLDRLARDDAP